MKMQLFLANCSWAGTCVAELPPVSGEEAFWYYSKPFFLMVALSLPYLIYLSFKKTIKTRRRLKNMSRTTDDPKRNDADTASEPVSTS
jgi:hypothetical protein